MKTEIYPKDYEKRMKEYNKHISELEEKRKKFYEGDHNFTFKSMYINVIAPPKKLVINYLD